MATLKPFSWRLHSCIKWAFAAGLCAAALPVGAADTDYRGLYERDSKCSGPVCLTLHFCPAALDAFIGLFQRKTVGNMTSLDFFPADAIQSTNGQCPTFIFRPNPDCSSDACVQVKANVILGGMTVLVRVSKRHTMGKDQTYILIEPLPGG